MDATDLHPGQWLRTSAGTYVQITAITRWTQQSTVHNLTVANIHTYYVLAGDTPVLVHNSRGNLCPHPDAEGPHTSFVATERLGRSTTMNPMIGRRTSRIRGRLFRRNESM
ncbi:hypothetical protein ACFRR7_16455 [Streptomyces sp. NPDC056909]|uniref:hypothetical protein n=1 Tax=Streptomyces sp. NPDC056909 TaxID=3345963 RepID=UPI003673AFB0